MEHIKENDVLAKNDTAENRETYHLLNSLEEAVVLKAKVTIPYDEEVCKCEKCFYDICAIVLNTIPPKYSTTTRGSLFARMAHLDKSESVQISVEIAKAIELVKQRPSH